MWEVKTNKIRARKFSSWRMKNKVHFCETERVREEQSLKGMWCGEMRVTKN